METALANYEYWREHGADWHTEYDLRKKSLVYYHSQQIMIAEYLRQCAPARVLEFGCGIGRHLRYLNAIPGLEVHGYDQSVAMVAGMEQWATQDWLQARVRTGPPVGRLPYADGEFDIVFTAEVLVHVRPEDLPSILAELIRVARWQVFHFEPSWDFPLDAKAHHGCWFHDLFWAYSEKGLSCETLPSGYREQRPYRVILDPARSIPAVGLVLPMLLRRMETDLQGTLDGWTDLGRKLEQLTVGEESASETAEHRGNPAGLAQTRCNLLSERVRAEQDGRTRAEQAQAAILAELTAAQAQRTALTEELAAERAKLAAEQTQRNALTEELAAERAKLAAEQTQRNALTEELAAERDKLTAEQTQRNTLSEELVAERAKLAAEQTQRTALSEELAAERDQAAAWRQDLAAEEDKAAALAGELAMENYRISVLNDELKFLRDRGTRLSTEVDALRRELTALQSSLGQRILARVRHMPGFPLLRSSLRATLAVRRALRNRQTAPLPAPPESGAVVPMDDARAWRFLHADPSVPVVAICHPRWQGVRSAAEGHSPNLLLMPQTDPSQIDSIVECLANSRATHFICDGFYTGYAELLTQLRRRLPSARLFYIHHGSFYQMPESIELPGILRQVLSLQRDGVIDRIGVCRSGMGDALKRLGFPAFEVMNRVPRRESLPPRQWRSPARVFVPVDARTRKNPHTQVIGAMLAEDIGEIHVPTIPDLQYLPADTLERVKLVGHGTLSRAETWELMNQSDLVLYVTVSECAPMVPLESLTAGVPCLTGDNHGLFDDFPALGRLLTVSREDDPWAIAAAIDTVREEYGSCCDLIRKFNVDYDRKAAKSLADFLELDAIAAAAA